MLPTNPLLNATAPAGPHLPTATLRQYAAGTLAPAAQHRVEAHALACPRCADMLEGLLQTPPTTTDQALAQLQQRLRRRVQLAPQALPATRGHRQHRLLALQLAAAAALLFGLVAGGWWTWQQRHAGPLTANTKVLSTAPVTAIPVAEAPSAASVTTTQPVASSVVRPAAAGGLVATRRRAKFKRAQDYVIVTVTKKCHCGASVDMQAEREKEENAVNELTQSTRNDATAGSLANSPAAVSSDSAVLQGRIMGAAIARKTELPAGAALVRTAAMPAAPAIAPAPVGGYGSWREKLRREAAKFKPELPEQPLSGSVQLRLLIGADGKIREIKVLHGLRADYDDEAQRLVCNGAGWVPGTGGGKRAAQPVEVAVPFQ